VIVHMKKWQAMSYDEIAERIAEAEVRGGVRQLVTAAHVRNKTQCSHCNGWYPQLRQTKYGLLCPTCATISGE